MKYLLEDDDESEEVQLSLIEVLKKWVKGGFSDDYVTEVEPMIEVPLRKNQIRAQTPLRILFDDDDDFLKLLDLSEDDIHFLKSLNSHYGFEFNDSYSSEEDYKEGYGPLHHFDDENKEKWNKISIMVSGKPYDWNNPDTNFLRNMLKTFQRPIDRIIDDYHYRKEEMMFQTALRDTDKELRKYLESIGFKLKRDWDILETTPANLIMYSHLLRFREGDFKSLFEKIVEKNKSNLGGWWDNMYEFQDYKFFDEDAFNRDVSQNLEKILEELEDEPEMIDFFEKMMKLTSKYKMSHWYPFSSTKKYVFKLQGFEPETKKLKLSIRPNEDKNYSEKAIKISPETFERLLHQPTLFDLDKIFEQKKMKTLTEGFDPIYFIKNFFKEKEDVFDRGDSWEMRDEMQKYVDILFNLVQKKKPSKSIKGLEVVKVSTRGFIRSFETNLKQEIAVVVNTVLPMWENPTNQNVIKEFEFYREFFRKLQFATGLNYDTKTGTELKFYLYLK